MVTPTQTNAEENRLTVITSHVNADFDALASMLAAQKLYPGALVVFPGSQERNLRNFFIQSMAYLFNLAEIKEIDLSAVRRMVVVDTRRADRIGKLAAVLRNQHVDIHLYDHHPVKADDIRASYDVHRLTGATVTILTEIIRDKGIDITPEEATIMCLGIYEDTGSFTFTSTTAQDLEAASYLFSKGANINVIANMITREISPEQIAYLNELIQSATRYMINGVEIVVTTCTSEQYLPDFAFLVHKMAKMEEINAIFALAQMENKIYIVARSRTEEVDVGAILSALGGGGHTFAAAVSIKGQTLVQAEQSLFRELYRQIRAQRQARHLMSTPAICVEADVSCKEAGDLLTRYSINALLVTAATGEKVAGSRLKGYITRQVIEKAIFHDLGQAPVRDYMSTEIAFASPDAELIEVQDKIIGNKQRILPVIEGETILGVITRTDLLNTLVQKDQYTRQNMPDPYRSPINARTRNITNFMQERLLDWILATLVNIGSVAEELNYQAYVVGGFVRDLFLYRPNEDIDIVIEGDGIAFAKAYARKHKARIHAHRAFGTAVIIFPDGFKIDVATARMEFYRSPAALPDVEMSSIKLDLFRRDFTMNTLAIHLNSRSFGQLIDFFSAQKDIKDKAIRVLHNLSFVEDPTRVFRALRFEQRFGFSIGKLTAGLIENAVKMDFFKRLRGRRVFAEIRLILEEENPTPAIVRMYDYDLLKVIHPSIDLDKQLVELLNEIKSVITWHDLLFIEDPYSRWMVYFMGLISHCDLITSEGICNNMELAPRVSRVLCQDRLQAQRCLLELEQDLPPTPSALYRVLHDYRTELILLMMAMTRIKAVKKAISGYCNQLAHVEPTLRGKDLIAMGLAPGPIFRQILEAVRDAKLDGNLLTYQDELAFARRYIKRHPQPGDNTGIA